MPIGQHYFYCRSEACPTVQSLETVATLYLYKFLFSRSEDGNSSFSMMSEVSSVVFFFFCVALFISKSFQGKLKLFPEVTSLRSRAENCRVTCFSMATVYAILFQFAMG